MKFSEIANRLTFVALPASGVTVTFKYDPFGRRIQKSSSSGVWTGPDYNAK
jgi:hypothetical protein